MRLFIAMVLLAGVTPPSAHADDIEAPRCLQVTKSAPYRGYGHNHIVHLNNTCDERLVCRVSTDATPEPQTVRLNAHEQKDVTTRVGSPASAFEARVDCEAE